MPRDYCDIASLREAGYGTRPSSIALAREQDTGLEPGDFADAAAHLDENSTTPTSEGGASPWQVYGVGPGGVQGLAQDAPAPAKSRWRTW